MATSIEPELSKDFKTFIHGKKITRSLDGQHFLEAFCLSKSPADAVQRIVYSKHGVEAMTQALRCDSSCDYIESYVTKFIHYIADPAVMSLAEGIYFDKILDAIVNPPVLWSQFIQYFKQSGLDKQAEAAREQHCRNLQRKLDGERSDERLRKILDEILEESKRMEAELEMKAKLKSLGVCPVGYEWTKQEGGYRCAGGSHYLSDADLPK